MSKNFTGKSLRLSSDNIKYALTHAGSTRNSGAVTTAAPSMSGSLRTDDDCPIAFVIEDIECFALDGVQNLKDTRTPTHLNHYAGETTEEKNAWQYLGAPESDTDIMALATRGGKRPYSYYILGKINYIAPCDINGLSFRIPGSSIFNPEPIALFGSLKDSAGVLKTGTAAGQLMGYYKTEQGTTTQALAFVPREQGSSVPPQTDDRELFCWVLLGVDAQDHQPTGDYTAGDGMTTVGGIGSALVCPDYIPCYDIFATKPEWSKPNMSLPSTSAWADAESANGPASGWTTGEWIQLFFTLTHFARMAVQDPDNTTWQHPDFVSGVDINSVTGVNIVDFVAYITFWQKFASGEVTEIDIYDLPPVVPAECCDDPVDRNVPEKKPCIADMEILDVICTQPREIPGGGTIRTFSGLTGATIDPDRLPPLKGKYGSDDDCDDDDSANKEYNAMYILVGIRNDLTVSGFQFDVGFNKFSSVPHNNISADLLHPDLITKNWNLINATYHDRFGYDKVVRVISWQPLLDFSNHHENKGYDIGDENFLAGLQTALSMEPSPAAFQRVVVVKVENAPPTWCPCPKKEYYIDGTLKEVKYPNADQAKNPDAYAEGTKWEGPVVYDSGRWWTAEASSGPLVRDASSMPLSVVWAGVELLNKRIVTNEKTYRPRHEEFGLKYAGIFCGFLDVIPSSYTDYVSYFNSAEGLGPWITKALGNGLNLGTSAPPSEHLSKYEYLEKRVFERQIEYLEAVSGSTISMTDRLALYNDFDKGFCDDANLDGKFDVADLVALFNGAQFRCLLPNPKLVSDDTSTTDVDWKNPSKIDYGFVNTPSNFKEFQKWGKGSDNQAASYSGGQTTSNSVTYDPTPDLGTPSLDKTPNILRVVPTYCLNTLCTSTMSDLCPDVCGNTDPETEDTLRSNSGNHALTGFSQRVDIMPLSNAKATFVFGKKPEVNAVMAIIDYSGYMEQVRFTADSTGTVLSGGFKAIQIGANLDATIGNIAAYFSSHTALSMTCSTLPTGAGSGRNGFILTQSKPGSWGNQKIKYTFGSGIPNSCNFITHQKYFTGGTSYLSNLPHVFRDWAEYFLSQHNIIPKDLYQNEEEYAANGATFFELQRRVALPLSKLTPLFNFTRSETATLNLCGGYASDTVVRIKVLPGDGFYRTDVYDAETGALLTAATTVQYNNFYTVPTHGKITIVSHNYYAANSPSKKIPGDGFKTSKHFTPITQDGGKLVIAKVFVTPMPVWEDGKYLKLLDGHNKTLSWSNGEIVSNVYPTDGVDSMFARIVASTANPTLSSRPSLRVGPVTSQFSQWYHDDSSSLHTYAEYMLHAHVVDTKIMRIKYNTMKPFKHVSFVVRTHNNAEIEKVVLAEDPTSAFPLEGWAASHTFHQDKADKYGLPLEPDDYSEDGYSVVNVYVTGSYTNEAGAVQAGVANPTQYNSAGDLCTIFFKEPICEELPLLRKKYICPPIGDSNHVFPPKRKEDKNNPNTTGIEGKYPEGSRDKGKHKRDSGEVPLIANWNADEHGKAVLTTTVGNDLFVDQWLAIPGVQLLPHNANNAHRPKYSVDTNDTRKSILFEGGMGLSGLTTGTGYRSHDLHQWSLYAMVNLTDTLNAHGSLSTGNKATIIKFGGNGTTQYAFTLQLIKTSVSGQFKLQAISQGNNAAGSPSQVTTTLEHTVTVSGSPASSVLHGWHIISWIGNYQDGTATLYVDGTQVATASTTQSDALGASGVKWYVGHDASNNNINGTIGNAAGSPLAGRLSQFLVYSEAHDSELQQKSEAFLAVKNQNEGTVNPQSRLPGGHIAEKGIATGAIEETGLTTAGYLKLHETDKEGERVQLSNERTFQWGKMSAMDLGSDRCAAAWVSDHVCLDKYAQTLLNVSCTGSLDDYTLGEQTIVF